jgi:hypothetical protein
MFHEEEPGDRLRDLLHQGHSISGNSAHVKEK